jgi:hypothetical protein
MSRGLASGRLLLRPPPPVLDAENVDEAETSPTPVPRRRAMGRSAGTELGNVELRVRYQAQ